MSIPVVELELKPKVKRPDLTKLIETNPELYSYIQALEDERDRFQAELEANAAQEAKGIAWSDCYAVSGDNHPVRINLTARSNVSTEIALRNLLDGLAFARTKGIVPYVVRPEDLVEKPKTQQQPPAQAQAPAPVAQPTLTHAQEVVGVPQVASVPAPTPQPAPAPVAPGTEIDPVDFPAEILEFSMNKGRRYARVIGGIYKKGITVWPEVLSAAGIEMAKIAPEVPSIPLTGYTAHAAKFPDQKGVIPAWPNKVTRLVKS